ncbi:MAG: ABC transporter substrate binding protein, partial [Pelobacteraceae bacterium]
MYKRVAFVPVFAIVIFVTTTLFPSRAPAAEVLVVADSQLRPAMEIISGIRKSLGSSLKIISPEEARRGLKGAVDREGARVVVALGKEALAEALALPPGIPVIFDMVVTPPVITRPNTTGFYLATPVREYSELIRKHLHSIRQMAVVGSRDQLTLLGRGEAASYTVRDTSEFVSRMHQMDSADAILLLPDTSVLTSAALDEAYLLSFRKGIPLLGVSERNVKEGALVALVVDMVNVGKLIGAAASKALKGVDIGQFPPSPPRKFDIYLNTATARRMKIDIPDEMVGMAKRVYP